MTKDPPIRLNRYLSVAGVTSRRKADELIAAGRVMVNGIAVTSLGTKVDPSADEIYLDGRQIVALDPKTYILLNKPKDTITTLSDERGRTSVRDYVGIGRRIFPVGRLDRHTTGVLILTNDGDFANTLMHPRNKVAKTYLVTADRPVLPEDLKRLAIGVRLSDGKSAPAQVGTVPGTKNVVVEITIREGRNRQIHRMFEAVGYQVQRLERVAYGPVTCEGLPRGKWRNLTPAEVRALVGVSGGGSPPVRKGPRKSAVRRKPSVPGKPSGPGKPAGPRTAAGRPPRVRKV